MKERPIFIKPYSDERKYSLLSEMLYCITKVMILQFNSENRTELARNG